MKKYRVRSEEHKDEFEIANVSPVDNSTKRFIAKAVVCTGLGALVLMAVHAVLTNDTAELASVKDSAILLTGLVLGYYFKTPDG